MSWRARSLTAWTSVVFILTTLLLSNPGDDRSALRTASVSSPSMLQLLTLPISRSQPADVRQFVLPIGLAGLLLIFAALPVNAPPKPSVRNKKERTAARETSSVAATSVFSSYWLELLAAATVALALVSAVCNDSWLISRGWILQLAAGCGWAILISRMADRRCIERILLAGSLIAVCAVAMSFGHRQAHHVEYFAWPIGPVTLTAGMAVLWAAVALAKLTDLLPGPSRASASPRSILWTVVVLGAVVAMLIVAARRGAWLAVLGAATYTAIVVAWRRGHTRRSRMLVLLSAALLCALVAAYIVIQSRSSDPKASIPVTYRLIYWKNTIENLADHWLLGHGPDMFMCKMSAIIGRQRAEMPRILHGTIDPEAHNEWLQAMFEIGAPGGLLYLAIPLMTVVLATRAWLRGAATDRQTVLLACAAGLVAILVSEGSSICLRRGGMNVWYWTLIGATVAWTRWSGGHSPRQARSPRMDTLARCAAVAAALALCFVLIDEGRRRIAHALGCLKMNRDDRLAVEELTQAGWRLGAWQAIAARADLGDAQITVARSLPQDSQSSREWASQAANTWRELNDLYPAYPGAACRLAQALQLAGDLPAACDVLSRFVTTINSYDMPANYLRVVLCPLEPQETLEGVRRALRDGEWMGGVADKVAAAFESPAVREQWPKHVLAAINAVTDAPTPEWANTLAPETLRIEAARFAAVGDSSSAARMQSIAVQAYSRLAEERSPYRRAPFAEADASLQHARFTFASDPSKPDDAFRFLSQAEQLAMQGVPQRAVADAGPKSEWVGGKVIPAEFPARLRPLWRFSALMHLAIGGDDRWANQRIEWSLPEEERTPQRVARELGALSSELVGLYERLEPNRRPSSFAALVALVHRYGPRPATAPGR